VKVNIAEVFNNGMINFIRRRVDPQVTEIVDYSEGVARFQGCETCGGDDTVYLEIRYRTPRTDGDRHPWYRRGVDTFRYEGSLGAFIRAMDEVDV
jgi:hypothetical protein